MYRECDPINFSGYFSDLTRLYMSLFGFHMPTTTTTTCFVRVKPRESSILLSSLLLCLPFFSELSISL